MKKLDLNLDVIGDITTSINDVLGFGKKLFKCWYGCESANTQNDARATIFQIHSRTAGNTRSLPPTNEAYEEYGK